MDTDSADGVVKILVTSSNMFLFFCAMLMTESLPDEAGNKIIYLVCERMDINKIGEISENAKNLQK